MRIDIPYPHPRHVLSLLRKLSPPLNLNLANPSPTFLYLGKIVINIDVYINFNLNPMPHSISHPTPLSQIPF